MTDNKSGSLTPLRIGFIPLADAAALLVAVDKGFARAEGLDVTLHREVSWSNVRDKLNLGLFDAAHLLAPVAIASSLGLGHVKVPIVAPFNLGLNGNAITVSPALHAAIMGELDGDPLNPLATAQALLRVVNARKKTGAEPLVFGMTFPFSTHNYQLRFWMAAGGVDPDEDVRLGGAAAALHGRKPCQRPCGRLLRRRAVELGRGRSRRRAHPAFRLRYSRARR